MIAASTRSRVLAEVVADHCVRPDSDLDLLVDVERCHGYFDMAGSALGVKDERGAMTQVATLHGLKLRIRDRVLREAIAL